MKRWPVLLVAVTLGVPLAACTSLDEQVVFHEALTLGGKKVEPEVLNHGRESYMQYCFSCHGIDGDGRGPASRAMRPPPRDFRSGIFKFAKVVDGLPHDEDLERIVRGGLQGTPMLPWDDIPEEELHAIIQYIKTLAPVWRDPDEELGQRILAGTDPFGPAQATKAIARGKAMYHGFATCQQCHAAYATRQEIFQASSEVGNQAITTFRDNLYEPEAKESDIRVGDHRVKILPPDFLWNDVRSGTSVAALYRTIAAGVPPVMPAWNGSLAEEDVWAIAYYVHSLIEMRGTPAAAELQETLAHQPEFVAPAAAAPAEGAAAAAPAEGAAAPAPAEGAAAPAPAEGAAAPAPVAPAAAPAPAPAAQ